MPSSTDTAIQVVLDRAALQDLMERYMRAIDRRDFETVVSCFTADAYADFNVFKGPIIEVLPRIREGIAHYGASMHFIGNRCVEIDGDTAHMETYAMNQHIEQVEGAPQLVITCSRYLDDLVRLDGRWLIRRRELKLEWRAQCQATPYANS